MATSSVGAPLVVIVGPTASGKSALAMKLAQKYNGEIISADSRAVYKGLDIGTAKPTSEDQNLVPHWGLDIAEPGERFTAADFKKYAYQKIDEIRQRDKVPFLVGGSGMYVDAVIFDYSFSGGYDSKRRGELEKLSAAELRDYCTNNNILLPENDQNKRYIIRAIEKENISAKMRQEPISNCIIVGITTDKIVLKQRMKLRAKLMIEAGVVDESIKAAKKYGWENEAMTGNVYRLIRQFVNQTISHDELISSFATQDWRLAKRQLTWMRRNKYIKWLSLDEAEAYLESQLATE